ncbi:UDP-glycosyltransferase 87A2 [Vitis vinifera]|uniref:UDP-glycosyltransferase 87A2 n=1 Tax=Vitis vinifera TaxID=29760 RepID=A0A438FAD1_VITVI|nr:UDP-glycosyltransferase 87A2 [Vitis vinifera]
MFSFPIYPVGPVLPYFNIRDSSSVTTGSDNLNYFQWLDSQPCNSVLYVSFGSVYSVSSAQVDEIAAGLRDSGVRFLWVARGEASRGREVCGEMGLVVPWCNQLKAAVRMEDRVEGEGAGGVETLVKREEIWIVKRTPPLGNTWHAAHSDAWHVLSAGPSSSGFPKDMHGADILSGRASRKGKRRLIFSLPRKSKRRWQSVHIRIVSTTHPDSQHEPSGYKSSGWSIKVK